MNINVLDFMLLLDVNCSFVFMQTLGDKIENPVVKQKPYSVRYPYIHVHVKRISFLISCFNCTPYDLSIH